MAKPVWTFLDDLRINFWPSDHQNPKFWNPIQQIYLTKFTDFTGHHFHQNQKILQNKSRVEKVRYKGARNQTSANTQSRQGCQQMLTKRRARSYQKSAPAIAKVDAHFPEKCMAKISFFFVFATMFKKSSIFPMNIVLEVQIFKNFQTQKKWCCSKLSKDTSPKGQSTVPKCVQSVFR